MQMKEKMGLINGDLHTFITSARREAN